MKHKLKSIKQERGITLIALIITIIVLVILAAVTLNSIFGSNIIGLATNGAINYAEEQQKELGMLNDVSDLLGDITGDTDRPMSPSIALSGTKGNNDIYTSNVTVTISINKGLEQTGTIKLHYKINDGEEQITEDDVSFEVSEEGTTKVTAWTENEKGNLSNNAETSFTINKTLPSNPTISLNGTEGEDEYYITDVGVTISAGDVADVASVKYKVEGANPIAETEVQGTTANFDITTDGTSTITAYIINTAGLTSEEITQVVNKDTVAPSTASIALSGEAGETSIAVTANGEDATSGVASYAFQYSTTNEESGFTTADEVQNTANSCTFEYQDLAVNTTYYLRVVVKDNAGNTKISNTVNAKIEREELPPTELAGNVGKYIDYIPESGTFSEHTNVNYSGSSDNSQLSTEMNLKWRILSADNNKLTLISDRPTSSKLKLYGVNGYNNGVLLLNNACEAMYSNSSLGATGRSIKIEDIEVHSSYRIPNEGSTFTTTSDSRTYPLIFAKEEDGAPNGTYGTQYSASEQDEYITGTGDSSSIKGKANRYWFEMSEYMEELYLEIFSYEPGTSTNFKETYGIATRCLGASTITGTSITRQIEFELQCVEDGSIFFVSLCNTSGGKWEGSITLRPIVEINLSQVNLWKTGDGTSNSPFSITAK